MLDVQILQTADFEQYAAMLALGRTFNEAYALRHGFRYHSHIGIKRGYFPWHATFNKIFLIHEWLMTGFRGWILYLDADAYVYDRDFDLISYLNDNSDKALIAAPGGISRHRWDINAGVLLINLNNETARHIVEDWYADIMQTSDEQLRTAKIWNLNVKGDQFRLIQILQKNPKYLDEISLVKRSFFNSHKATFIRHVLRVRDGKKLSMAERITMMKEDASAGV